MKFRNRLMKAIVVVILSSLGVLYMYGAIVFANVDNYTPAIVFMVIGTGLLYITTRLA